MTWEDCYQADKDEPCLALLVKEESPCLQKGDSSDHERVVDGLCKSAPQGAWWATAAYHFRLSNPCIPRVLGHNPVRKSAREDSPCLQEGDGGDHERVVDGLCKVLLNVRGGAVERQDQAAVWAAERSLHDDVILP